jgi:hypothetical protein
MPARRTSTEASLPAQHAFTATVEPVAPGVPFYVVFVPAKVSAAFGRGRVNVRGAVEGVEIYTSLVPMQGGRHKLFLNGRVRKAAKIAPGDRVKVTLAKDAAPREEALPDDLVRALRDADALGPFQRLARSTRNEVVRWIDDAKAEATREKRIGRAVERGLAARDKEIDRQAKARPSKDEAP